MKNELMAKAGRAFGKAGLSLKKHSPEILMVAGIAGTVASTVMACKATRKIDGVLEEPKRDIKIIHKAMEDGEVNGVEYTKEDGQKDLTITYVQTGVKLLKLYAPAIALGTVSIMSIVAGHHILKKRNIALAAAYAVVDKGFKDYRKNVVERFGKEIDKELRYNIKAKEFETVTVDEEGKESIEKEIVDVVNIDEYSTYARAFDCGNKGWEKDSEYNLMYLRKQQEWANEKLRSQGYLFLNDVYDMLGIPRSKAGQVVGWMYDEKNPTGDNYVDFGIYDINKESCRNFVNGYERSIWLDFNVDGNIMQYMA